MLFSLPDSLLCSLFFVVVIFSHFWASLDREAPEDCGFVLGRFLGGDWFHVQDLDLDCPVDDADLCPGLKGVVTARVSIRKEASRKRVLGKGSLSPIEHKSMSLPQTQVARL